MTKLLKKIIDRFFDYLSRPRNIGLRLIALGVMLAGASFGMDYLGKIEYRDGQRHVLFNFSTGEGLPKWMVNTVFFLGLLLIVVGLLLTLYSFISSEKILSRKLAVVVELKGLHASPDTPAKDADLGPLSKNRQWLKLDFRPKSEADMVDPELALQKISGLKGTIQTIADGRDPSDVAIAVGGLAAVPALFLTGMLLDDESEITLYDWHRDSKRWRLIDDLDDGKRMMPVDYSTLPDAATEIVLAVSLSYSVSLSSVRAAFQDLIVLELRAEEIIADKYWSSEKQQAIVATFRAVTQELLHRGVSRIHMVLAAPASLSIRLGMSYDRRLMPELLVYQYEKSCEPPYPWAFAMPTHGHHTARIVTFPKAA